MNTTKWLSMTMAAFAVVTIGTSVTASARSPQPHQGCYTGGACHRPVGFYLDHKNYPGLNTYHVTPTNPNNPNSQAQPPRRVQFKHHRNMVIVPR